MKGSSMHNKPLTDLFKNEKVQELHYLLSRSPNKDSVCALQEAPAGAIVFGQSQSCLSFWSSTL
jgi:hypothetical protein